MQKKEQITAILTHIQSIYGQPHQTFSLPELQGSLAHQGLEIPERTLRRRLRTWVEEGQLVRSGQKRGARYQLSNKTPTEFLGFLSEVEPGKRSAVLNQIRNLWTHSSTALEGNTLTLGDTHAILNLGLTISGKPLREHTEVLGHARAIDLLYQMTRHDITIQHLLDLHKAVQQEIIFDTLAPIGNWKVEPNYTSSVTSDNRAVTIEYAAPADVPTLMTAFVETLNSPDIIETVPDKSGHPLATAVYANLHLAFVHIHPFADGNGRIARLVSNLPLLKAGFPPLLIDQDRRREYITLLADYQTAVSPLTPKSISARGLLPDPALAKPFQAFCASCYDNSYSLIFNE